MRIRLNKQIDYLKLIQEVYTMPDFKVEISGGNGTKYIVVRDLRNDKKEKDTGEYDEPISYDMIGYTCPHCGCELYGKWFLEHPDFYFFGAKSVGTEYRKIVDAEKEHIRKMSCCPLCSGKLLQKEGYYIEKKVTSNDPDVYFGLMKNARLVNERRSFKEKIEEKSTLWSNVLCSSSSSEMNEIKTNTEKLKEYILNLIRLEVNAYSVSKRLEHLYKQQVELQRALNLQKYLPDYEKKQKIEDIKNAIFDCEEKIKDYADGRIKPKKIDVKYPIKPKEPLYATAGLFNKKKVLAENEALKSKYQMELKHYEEQMILYEEAEKKEIARLISEIESKITACKEELQELQKSEPSSNESIKISEGKLLIDEEIANAETLLKNICECRSRIYSYNIVFEKYRNVVALSTFYEYLMAGRCAVLEGHEGAYNIYENEIRANMIISQLTQVLEKLDEIKDAQYMIYSELQTVNRSLDHLNKTMDTALVSIQNMESDMANISANTDVIAHNTAVTAYYSKMNAELTNSLGYLVAFK